MKLVKVIEVISASDKSIEDAVHNAVVLEEGSGRVSGPAGTGPGGVFPHRSTIM